ncbi:hypothetical protein U27_05212 [Candidatus Vecturithrix granuli]|uniref:Uncharacterized protein n=1 Tax=Vecturithrix granuli TaxID=1499967 RepID=A0A081C0Y4_VECG1|nr:hypothetical protein U27_05212 [Candidatus Vecturithrix granuli]
MQKFQYNIMWLVLVTINIGFWGCSRDKDMVTAPTAGSKALNQAVAAADMSCVEYNNPAITSNNEFRIELMPLKQHGNLFTFTYQICKLETSPEVKDLRYWVLGLDQFFPYLAENMTMSDLYVNCGILDTSGNETCGLTVLDPATQVMGVKFDALRLRDEQCQSYLVTLDGSALAEEFQIGTGSVVVATKAGNQDFTTPGAAAPGIACVAGPGVQEKL